jgi:hypothetical protein
MDDLKNNAPLAEDNAPLAEDESFSAEAMEAYYLEQVVRKNRANGEGPQKKKRRIVQVPSSAPISFAPRPLETIQEEPSIASFCPVAVKPKANKSRHVKMILFTALGEDATNHNRIDKHEIHGNPEWWRNTLAFTEVDSDLEVSVSVTIVRPEDMKTFDFTQFKDRENIKTWETQESKDHVAVVLHVSLAALGHRNATVNGRRLDMTNWIHKQHNRGIYVLVVGSGDNVNVDKMQPFFASLEDKLKWKHLMQSVQGAGAKGIDGGGKK